jgi:hypothetical protein
MSGCKFHRIVFFDFTKETKHTLHPTQITQRLLTKACSDKSKGILLVIWMQIKL